MSLSKDSKDLLGHFRTCFLSFEDVQATSLWGMVPIEFHLPSDWMNARNALEKMSSNRYEEIRKSFSKLGVSWRRIVYLLISFVCFLHDLHPTCMAVRKAMRRCAGRARHLDFSHRGVENYSARARSRKTRSSRTSERKPQNWRCSLWPVTFNGWIHGFLICDLLPLLVETNNPQLSQLRHHCTRVATGTTCSLRFPAFCLFCFRIFVSCYVIVVSTWTKIWSIQWGTGQFGTSCKLLPLRVTIILLRCSKELNDKIESRYLLSSPLTTTILTAARKGSESRIFSKPVFKLRTTRPPVSRDCFLLCFFTDWAFFISVKKMLITIILCTKWFLLRVQYATVVQPEGCDRFSISILGSLDMSFTLMFSSYLAMLSIFGSANAKCINMPPPNADKSYFLSWRLPVSSSGPGSSRRGKMYENWNWKLT